MSGQRIFLHYFPNWTENFNCTPSELKFLSYELVNSSILLNSTQTNKTHQVFVCLPSHLEYEKIMAKYSVYTSPLVPKIIVLVSAAVNHLHTVSTVSQRLCCPPLFLELPSMSGILCWLNLCFIWVAYVALIRCFSLPASGLSWWKRCHRLLRHHWLQREASRCFPGELYWSVSETRFMFASYEKLGIKGNSN